MKKFLLYLLIFVNLVSNTFAQKDTRPETAEICEKICGRNIQDLKDTVEHWKAKNYVAKGAYEQGYLSAMYLTFADNQLCQCQEHLKIFEEAGVKLNEQNSTYALSSIWMEYRDAEQLTDIDMKVAKLLLKNGADACFTYDKNDDYEIYRSSFIDFVSLNPFSKKEMDSELVEMMIKSCKNKKYLEDALVGSMCTQQSEIAKLLLPHCKNQKSLNESLLCATAAHQTELVKLLLDQGADPNYMHKYNVGTSREKVDEDYKAGKYNEIQSILMIAFDSEHIAKGGFAPLMAYIPFPDTELVQALIDKGAKVNAIGKRNEHDITALDFAINLYLRNIWGISIISEEKRNEEERRKIQEAIASFPQGIKVIKLLVNHGAKTKEKYLFGAIEVIERYQNKTHQMVSDPVLIKILLENGEDVDMKDKDDNIPLHLAAHSCNLPIVKLLIEKGAKVNTENKNKKTPLDMVGNHSDFQQNECDKTKEFLKKHLNGVVRTYYYGNEIVESETNYKNGKLDGVSKFYNKNGKLKSEIEYKNGKKNGLAKTYYDNGKIQDEIKYKDDKSIYVNMYDENGKLIDPSLHGEWLEKRAKKKSKH